MSDLPDVGGVSARFLQEVEDRIRCGAWGEEGQQWTTELMQLLSTTCCGWQT